VARTLQTGLQCKLERSKRPTQGCVSGQPFPSLDGLGDVHVDSLSNQGEYIHQHTRIHSHNRVDVDSHTASPMYHPDDKVDVFYGDPKRREDPLNTGVVHPAFRRRQTDDSEGLIPVTPADSKAFYVVDCPSLHLVDSATLFPDRSLPGSDVSRCDE
jgi:hypothetical protein